jgi:hypothetical protein
MCENEGRAAPAARAARTNQHHQRASLPAAGPAERGFTVTGVVMMQPA